MKQNRREQGLALIFVLWIVLLLSAIAFDMTYRVRMRMQAAQAAGDSTKAYFLARSAVEKAMADLAESAQDLDLQTEFREDPERYMNVPLGEGAYTLFAGVDEDAETAYGLMDECGKLNINTAEATVMERLVEIGPQLATDIVALRQQEALADLKDLYLLEGVDAELLFGEDQNENGLLDSNENDGARSWPNDNSDGILDAGLSQYITVWSVARDVSASGKPRLNLNEAEAADISKDAPEVSEQQADSIVAHRQKGQFVSVLDLLEVDLVQKVAAGEGQPQQPSAQPAPQQNGGTENKPNSANTEEKQPNQNQNGEEKKPEEKPQAQPNEAGKPEDQGANGQNAAQQQPQFTYVPTGQKAFDESTFRKIADSFTIHDKGTVVGPINVNTASATVLACLPGMDETLGHAIVTERRQRNRGFKSVAELLEVRGMAVQILKPVYQMLSVSSGAHAVRGYGVVGEGEMYRCVYAVLDSTGDAVRIASWKEPE